MVKHLVNFHRSQLTPRVWRQTLYTPAILLPLLLREKEISINLLHTECPRDIAGNRDSGDPEVASKSGAKHIHGLISFLHHLSLIVVLSDCCAKGCRLYSPRWSTLMESPWIWQSMLPPSEVVMRLMAKL
jgi:hypothetical protein